MPEFEPHCPQCRTSVLAEKTLSDQQTRIDVCPTCRGAWFDARELASVLSVAVDSLELPADAIRTSRICPKCGVPLSQIDYPETKIEVDVCGQCAGIWLDCGEFRDLNQQRARHQDKSKFEPPPANLREAATRFVNRVIDRLM